MLYVGLLTFSSGMISNRKMLKVHISVYIHFNVQVYRFVLSPKLKANNAFTNSVSKPINTCLLLNKKFTISVIYSKSFEEMLWIEFRKQ